MTKSIRIKNTNNEKATVWPIGEFHYNVHWDDEPANNFRVAKHTVDEFLADGRWTEIDDNELPDSFKFTVVNGLQDFYVATRQGTNYHITWNGSTTGGHYSVEAAERHVETGNWEIIEDNYKENWTTATTFHQGEKVMHEDELLVCADDEEQDNVLDTIRHFTFHTGHSVEIVNGEFRVYREDEFDSYTTDCEHCLLDIMKAIEVLDEHSED